MEFVDIHGSGFVEGIPGQYANCRVYYQDGEVRHVGPLYQEWFPVQGLRPPHQAAQPIIIESGEVPSSSSEDEPPVQDAVPLPQEPAEISPAPEAEPTTARSTTFSG